MKNIKKIIFIIFCCFLLFSLSKIVYSYYVYTHLQEKLSKIKNNHIVIEKKDNPKIIKENIPKYNKIDKETKQITVEKYVETYKVPPFSYQK